MTVMYIVLAVFAVITVFVGIPAFLSEIGFFEYLKGKKEKKKNDLGKEKIILVGEPHESRWQVMGGEKEEKEKNTNTKEQ